MKSVDAALKNQTSTVKCPNCGSEAGFVINNAIIKYNECSDIYLLPDGVEKTTKFYRRDIDLSHATVVCLDCNSAIEDFNLKFNIELELVNQDRNNTNIWEQVHEE